MANVLIQESTMSAIGNAIRQGTEMPDLILPSDMPGEITKIKQWKDELAALSDVVFSSVFQGSELRNVTFKSKVDTIRPDAFAGLGGLKTINVPWREGEVANAPWGADGATINYGYGELLNVKKDVWISEDRIPKMYAPNYKGGEEYGKAHFDVTQRVQIVGTNFNAVSTSKLVFYVAFDIAKFEDAGNRVVDFGVVFIPYMYLNGRRLESNKTYDYNGRQYKPNTNSLFYSSYLEKINGVTYTSASFSGLYGAYQQMDYALRAYVQYENANGETITEYSDDGGGERTQYAQVYAMAQKYIIDPEADQEVVEKVKAAFGL